MPVNQDVVSSEMGRLLLSGFCLLDRCCNKCQNPLMKSPRNELHCVNCAIARQQGIGGDEVGSDDEKSNDDENEDKSDAITSIIGSPLKNGLLWATEQASNKGSLFFPLITQMLELMEKNNVRYDTQSSEYEQTINYLMVMLKFLSSCLEKGNLTVETCGSTCNDMEKIIEFIRKIRNLSD